MCRSARLPGRSAGGPALRGAGRDRGRPATRAEPCSLADAINGASANDEVIVTAGEYTISGAPINVVYGGLQIHGDLAGPMPRVVADSSDGLPAINLNAAGGSLSYLEVVNDGTEGGRRSAASKGPRLERVRASVIGEGAAGAERVPGLPVRDSLFRGRGDELARRWSRLATVRANRRPTVRNVTAIATGGRLGRDPVPLQRFRSPGRTP